MENLYENPKIEIIEINVEKGFATTDGTGQAGGSLGGDDEIYD